MRCRSAVGESFSLFQLLTPELHKPNECSYRQRKWSRSVFGIGRHFHRRISETLPPILLLMWRGRKAGERLELMSVYGKLSYELDIVGINRGLLRFNRFDGVFMRGEKIYGARHYWASWTFRRRFIARLLKKLIAPNMTSECRVKCTAPSGCSMTRLVRVSFRFDFNFAHGSSKIAFNYWTVVLRSLTNDFLQSFCRHWRTIPA